MLLFLIQIIRTLTTILIIAIIVEVILSYFLPPYHSLRRLLNVIVDPLLAPLRKVIPTFQGIDFSPVILIILIQVVESVLIRLITIFA